MSVCTPISRSRRQLATELTLALLALLLAGVSGCSHVITQTTPYFKDGPSQLEPPQGELEKGTHVLVLGKEGTYSRVLTLGGVNAYVWDGALRSIWAKEAEPEDPRAARERKRREAEAAARSKD
ncbi:MAG: hypothetical protein PVJ57_17020 [Phycisphaerae bacterium]